MICTDEGRASRITVGTPNSNIIVEPAFAGRRKRARDHRNLARTMALLFVDLIPLARAVMLQLSLVVRSLCQEVGS